MYSSFVMDTASFISFGLLFKNTFRNVFELSLKEVKNIKLKRRALGHYDRISVTT